MGLLWGKLSPGVHSLRLDSRDDERGPIHAWPSGISGRPTLHSSASRSFEDNLTPTSSRGNYTTPPLSVILAANRDARRTMISKPFAGTPWQGRRGAWVNPISPYKPGIERGRGKFSPLFCRMRHLQPSPPRSFVCSLLAEIAK